jgi:hypothetical protein
MYPANVSRSLKTTKLVALLGVAVFYVEEQ